MRTTRFADSRLPIVATLLTVTALFTCGDDDGPSPTSDSGSETDSSIRLDSSPGVDANTGEDATPPPADTGSSADTGSTPDDGSTPTDGGGGSCAPESASCANGEACCDGLMCCTGVPVPPGSEFCGVTCPRSDRDLKQDFETVDVEEALEGVLAMEITRWSYRDAPGVRHLGPMAQDFHAAFQVGETPRNIAPIDAQGAAFAAIQALARRQEQLLTENADLRARMARLERLQPRTRTSSRRP